MFSLLTSYADAPYGLRLSSAQHYNVYFPGNALLMAPPLLSGATSYEDDTDASVSQQAKDVSAFLTWTANPDHDERKRAGVKAALLALALAALVGYRKRFLFAPFKTRRVRWHPPDKPLR